MVAEIEVILCTAEQNSQHSSLFRNCKKKTLIQFLLQNCTNFILNDTRVLVFLEH